MERCTSLNCFVIMGNLCCFSGLWFSFLKNIYLFTWLWGWGDPLEEGMATHSSILAWRIPWTEEPGGLQSIGSQRDMTEAT